MNVKQANWARQHDWYYGEQNSESGIILLVKECGNDNPVLKFTSFTALRIWAGY